MTSGASTICSASCQLISPPTLLSTVTKNCLRLCPRRAGAVKPGAPDAIGSGADATGSGRADATGSGRADAMGSGRADAMGPQTGKPGDAMALVLTTERGVNGPNGDIKGLGGCRALAMEEGWQPGDGGIPDHHHKRLGHWIHWQGGTAPLQAASRNNRARCDAVCSTFTQSSRVCRHASRTDLGTDRYGSAVQIRSYYGQSTMASAYHMKYTSNKCSRASPD